MSATVADVLVDGLQRSGVVRLFAFPDPWPAAEVLEAARRRGLDVVSAEDAAAACIMAAVTGELTDTTGVVVAARATDVERAIPGIAHAGRDHAALIVLTTEAGAGSLLAPSVKASVSVAPTSAGRSIAQAINLALTAPRGPVHVDLRPGAAAPAVVMEATPLRPGPLPPASAPVLDEMARQLEAAARPVIVAGAQCRSAAAAQWLCPFAEALPAPVLVTVKAKGVLADRHPLHLGLWPDEGRRHAALLGLADLVVMIGVESGEGEESTLGPPVLRLAEAAADGARDRFVADVVGEIALVLAELAPRLRGRVRADWDVARLDQLKRGRRREANPAAPLTLEHAAEIARELAERGAVAAVDAGPDLPTVAAAWEAEAPHELLASAGLATTGFALPAAVAAQLVDPRRRVLCFTGEPGLAAAGCELRSVVRLGLPIVVVAVGDAARVGDQVGRAGIAMAAAADEAGYRHTLRRAIDARAPAVVSVGVRAAESTV